MAVLIKSAASGSDPIFNKNIVAVIVAIEDYRNKDIAPVIFAKNDAEAFRDLLIEELGADPKRVNIWRDMDATQAVMENDLAYEIRQLTVADLFIFYYAGHGFHSADGNRLTVWDTNTTYLENTTILVNRVLLEPLANSACRNSMIFLDACAKNFVDKLSGRDMLSSMSSDEFEAFAKSGDFHALYSSCSPGQKSYPSKVLKHGIWTWHLIDALKGNQPNALYKKDYITDRSLQDYLSTTVPDFIRNEMTKKYDQVPFMKIASSNTVILRHMPKTVAVVKSAPKLILGFADAYLRSAYEYDVKKLKSFPKNYKPPQYIGGRGTELVQQYAELNISEELDEIYNKAKGYFNLKRRDMDTSVRRSGGYVTTPSFRYELEVTQDTSDPATAVFERTLFLWVPMNELDSEFNRIFPVMPDQIVIPIEGRIDFDQLVDQFEDFEEEHGGKLLISNAEGKITYTTSDDIEFIIDVNESLMIASAGMGYNILSLIDTVSTGLEKLTGKPAPLLPDSSD